MYTIVGILSLAVLVVLINGSVVLREKRQTDVITGGGTGVDPAYLASLLAGGPAPPDLISTGTGGSGSSVPNNPGTGGTGGNNGGQDTGGPNEEFIVAKTRPPLPSPPTTTETTVTKKPKRPRTRRPKTTTKKPRRGTRRPKRTTRKPKRTTTPQPIETTPEPVETTELVFVETTIYNVPETEAPESTDFGFDFDTTTDFGTTSFFNLEAETRGGELATTKRPKGGRITPGRGGATKFGPVAPPEGDGTDPGILPLLPEVTGGTGANFFGVDAGTKKGFANGQGGKSAGAAIPGLGFFGGSKGGGLQGCGKVGGGKSVGIGNFGSVNKGTSVDLSAIPGIGKVLGRC